MERSSNNKEKRKHPRVLIRLPIHFQINGNGGIYPGMTVDASECGLLIQTLNEMPVGVHLDIEVLFPKEFEFANFKAATEIIWRGVGYWEDWEGYQYGLRFIEIPKGDYLKLDRILSNPSSLKEAYLIEDPEDHPTLIVKAE
jgi:PilZ domain